MKDNKQKRVTKLWRVSLISTTSSADNDVTSTTSSQLIVASLSRVSAPYLHIPYTPKLNNGTTMSSRADDSVSPF